LVHIERMAERIDEIQTRLAALSPERPARPAGSRAFARILAEALECGSSPESISSCFLSPSGTSGGAAAGPHKRLSPAAVDPIVQAAARKYGLAPELIHAVIEAESDYDPRCVSHAGAMGLMQLMPETARDFGITDPFDPAQNIDGGCRELKGYLKRFKRLDLALAAYNAGPWAVRKYGGIPPYRETRAYIRRVFSLLRQKGLDPAGYLWRGRTDVPGTERGSAAVRPSGKTAKLSAGTNQGRVMIKHGSGASGERLEPQQPVAAQRTFADEIKIPAEARAEIRAYAQLKPVWPEKERPQPTADGGAARIVGSKPPALVRKGPADRTQRDGGILLRRTLGGHKGVKALEDGGLRCRWSRSNGEADNLAVPLGRPEVHGRTADGRAGRTVEQKVRDGIGAEGRPGAVEAPQGTQKVRSGAGRVQGLQGEADGVGLAHDAEALGTAAVHARATEGAQPKRDASHPASAHHNSTGEAWEAGVSGQPLHDPASHLGAAEDDAKVSPSSLMPKTVEQVHRLLVRVEDENGALTVLASHQGGAVYAHVTVRDAGERQMLQQAFPHLQAALQREQIDLAGLGVSVGSHTGGNLGQGWEHGGTVVVAGGPPSSVVLRPPSRVGAGAQGRPQVRGLLHIYA